MYGVPKDFDSSRLIGCVLDVVSFSVNTVHFAFSDDVSITVESCFRHSSAVLPNDPVVVHVPVSESNLMQLLGAKIEAVNLTTEGSLILLFDNGHCLDLIDDSTSYEAYRIRIGAEEIVV